MYFLLRSRPVFFMLLGAFVMGAISGYASSLFSIKMTLEGISPAVIGYADSAQSAAILAVTLGLPKVLYRIPLIYLYVVGCTAGIVAMLGLSGSLHSFYLLLALRLLLGVGTNTLYIACEYWLNSNADDSYRGKLLALYGIAVVLGMGAGPLLVPPLVNAGFTPFVVGAGLFALCFLPALLAIGKQQERTEPPKAPTASLWGIMKLSPTVTVAGLLFGAAEASLFAFMPAYGLKEGLTEMQSALLLTCVFWGGLLAQLPMGWLADRFSSRTALLLAAAVGIIGALLLPAVIHAPEWLRWGHVAVWGGMMITIYIVSMGLLGREHKEADLATATLAFILMYGIGGIAGPSLTGIAMERLGTQGFPLVLALACGVIFLFTAARMMQRKR